MVYTDAPLLSIAGTMAEAIKRQQLRVEERWKPKLKRSSLWTVSLHLSRVFRDLRGREYVLDMLVRVNIVHLSNPVTPKCMDTKYEKYGITKNNWFSYVRKFRISYPVLMIILSPFQMSGDFSFLVFFFDAFSLVILLFAFGNANF